MYSLASFAMQTLYKLEHLVEVCFAKLFFKNQINMKQSSRKNVASLGYRNKKAITLATEFITLSEPLIQINKKQISGTQSLLVHCTHGHLNTLVDLSEIKNCNLLYFNQNKQFTGAIAVNKKAKQVYQVMVQQSYVLLVQADLKKLTEQLISIEY